MSADRRIFLVEIILAASDLMMGALFALGELGILFEKLQ
jgi:hypothetical protein